MRIVIIGAGKLGYKLAETLSSDDHDVTVVDQNDQALIRVSSNLDVLTVKGNGAQLKVLQQFNMERTHVVAAVTDSDETNIVICLMAKKMGCARVIARVRNPEYANQIEFLKEEFGLDFIINPELEMAQALVRYLVDGSGLYMEQFAHGRVGLLEYSAANRPELAGKTLQELDVFRSILVVAISRDGEIIVPGGGTVIDEGDVLYLIGKQEDLRAFHSDDNSLKSQQLSEVPRNVMILGGGNAGFYLAQHLQRLGSAVKIVEQDADRCSYLAENLKDVLVIHGDGTDHDLLEEENLVDMDALVALTGLDEENLLLALLGKQHGIGKVVAKVSRSNFIPIIEQLGIDLALNPVLISAASTIRFIEGGHIASLSLLFGGQAEVLEIIVTESSQASKVPLRDLKLPDGIIVGAIVHHNEITIPTGDSIIMPGDRVVVFCMGHLVAQLEKWFYRQKGGFLRELWRGM